MQKKSLLTVVLSLVLVAVIGVGSTLAYMSAQTAVKKNVFTSTPELKGQIKESKFDGLNWDGVTKVDPQEVPTLGSVKAAAMVPGMVIDKDPMVKNNTDKGGVSAYIAVRLKIYGDAVNDKMSYDEKIAAIGKFATINFNTKDWEQDKTDKYVFYYTKSVDAQDNTNVLFDKVTIKDQKTSLSTDGIAASDIKNFNIDISASLVQASGVGDDYAKSYDAAKAPLLKLLPVA